MGENTSSLMFLRNCFSSDRLSTDQLASMLFFYVNVMHRIDSLPEEKVLAASFFISLGKRTDALYEITDVKGMSNLRQKTEDFKLLQELYTKYFSKAKTTIENILQPASGVDGIIGVIESYMGENKYVVPLDTEDKQKIWNSGLRDVIRVRLPKQKMSAA